MKAIGTFLIAASLPFFLDTAFEMYVDSGYTVIVLSNYDHPAAQRVAAKLREMITQD